MNADPIVETFRKEVNMTISDLQKHLDTPKSREVGWKAHEGEESVGHREGAKIMDLLRKKVSDFDADDLKHMHKVVGYIHRHMAQQPEGDIRDTNWRASLMNWGHDPLTT